VESTSGKRTKNNHTEANFDAKLREFSTCHAADQECHELVQQLLHPNDTLQPSWDTSHLKTPLPSSQSGACLG
jgi:hypothetical protein